jgi:hypothetical protein
MVIFGLCGPQSGDSIYAGTKSCNTVNTGEWFRTFESPQQPSLPRVRQSKQNNSSHGGTVCLLCKFKNQENLQTIDPPFRQMA